MKKIAIMGLCGIGMSAIAQFLQEEGQEVFGSDINYKGKRAEELQQLGIEVYPEDGSLFNRKPDFLVKSSGIKDNNLELRRAQELGIKIISRKEMMGEITQKYNKVLAVAGTHGKTTSTTLLSEFLTNLGLNPTIFAGGIMTFCNNNFKLGGKEILILEADESDGTFLEIKRDIALVTNINWDHPDFFPSFEACKEAFKVFSQGSTRVIIPEGERQKIPDIKALLTFGLKANNDLFAKNLQKKPDGLAFDLLLEGENYPCKIKAFGEHNVANALGVLAVGLALASHDKEKIITTFQETLKSFQGVARRFNFIEKRDRPHLTVIDDYAHHPNEIKTTIAGAKDDSRLIVLWQPHRFTRVETFLSDFLESFYEADFVLVSDIYAGGEKPIDGLSGAVLKDKLSSQGIKTFFTPGPEEIFQQLDKITRAGDKILFLGAGTSSDWAHSFA